MKIRMHRLIKPQSGNALFLILIAVALFAALAYAVSQSGRGGADVRKETNTISAAQITQYASSVRTATQRMILTGTAATSIEFCATADADSVCSWGFSGAFEAPCTAGANCVFAPDGGGIPTQPLVPGGFADTSWIFYEIGATAPYRITGVGTNAPDGIMMTAAVGGGISKQLCEALNKGLGLPVPVNANSAFTFDPVDAHPGEPFQCFKYSTAEIYYYVHTLIER